MKQPLLIVILAALSVSCAAQAPCRGTSFRGTILDPSAALVPDASLTIEGGISVHSRADGRFEFPCLAAGTYRLTVIATGFSPLELAFQMPHSAAVELTLKLDSVEASIDVSGEDGPPNPTNSGATQTLAGKALQALADDPDDLLRELQQMGAAAGGSPSSTIITVDGFQDSTALPPKSSIAYIKVNPDLYSAEYYQPPYTGGRIEIYTKPGQKAFHGALFTTNGSPFENARDPFATSKAPLGKQRYGFELSGPVRPGVRQGGGSDFALTLEHRSIDNFAVVNAITLGATGNQVNTIANVATPQRLWLPTARLDWQFGSRNTVIASYTGSVNSLRNLGVGGTSLTENGFNSERYDHTLRLSAITTVSTHLMQEARVSLRWDGETDSPTSSASEIAVAGAFTGGGAALGPQQLHELRLEGDDDVILTTTHHVIKFGIQSFTSREHHELTTDFNGTYIFGGGPAPNLTAPGQTEIITGLEQYRRALLGIAGGSPTAYTVVTGTPKLVFTQVSAALFVQDDWTLSHGFHLSFGLRYFLQNSPLLLNGATPRLGLQWALGKDAKWTIHAHAGLFTSSVSPTEETEILREDGSARVTRTFYDPTFGNPLAGANAIQSVRTVNPHFSNLDYFSDNLGLTHTLPHGWNLSADITLGRIWNRARSNNINAPLTASPFGPRPGAANLNVLEVQASGQGHFEVESLGVEQHSLKRLQLFLSALHFNQIDDNDGNIFFTPQNSRSNAGEFAPRTNQAVYQLFGNGTLTLPAKLEFSTNIYAAGRAHYNLTTGFDNNGDGNFNDRPQYAPPGALDAIPTHYGLLVSSGGTLPVVRNLGVMPWTIHLDGNLQRAFRLTRNAKAEHQQTITFNLRSSNLLNHTNVTAVGGVLGSPLFGIPYTADSGRRIEAGLRYSF